MCMKSAGAHAEVVISITEMDQVRMEDPDEDTLIQSWMCSDNSWLIYTSWYRTVCATLICKVIPTQPYESGLSFGVKQPNISVFCPTIQTFPSPVTSNVSPLLFLSLITKDLENMFLSKCSPVLCHPCFPIF